MRPVVFCTAIILVQAACVGAQNTQSSLDLAGVISEAASLASDFGTPTSISSTPSTASSSSSTPAVSSTSAPATSATSAIPTPTSSVDPTGNGIDPHTRTIIIAICVPVGLLLIGILIGCVACCCIRRRRRNRRLTNPETIETRSNDWVRGENGHHGYVSSGSNLNHPPRIPSTAQQDSSPLMGEIRNDTRPASSIHPAYRSHSWGSSHNVNTQNPFTPNPPVTRKPVPVRHGHGHAALAAGAAAGVGAAAAHHRKSEQQDRDVHQGRPASNPFDSGEYSPHDELKSPFRDPNRPPTPFGLDAFGASEKRSSQGRIEPSVAAHDQEHPHPPNVEHPTEAQRRSLQEHDMLATEPEMPERSPKRTSFGHGGYAINPNDTPRPTFVNSGYARNDSTTSNESWQSAEAAPPRPQQHYYEDAHHYAPGRRQSEDNGYSEVPLVAPNAVWNNNHRYSGESASSRMSNGPRRFYGPDGNPRQSFGADGKPRRLRFSDLQPEEYHYSYDQTHPVGQAL